MTSGGQMMYAPATGGGLRLGSSECRLASGGRYLRGEWTIDRTYTTSAIHIEEGLLREHIPDPMDLVGRALELPPALSDILGRTLDASIAEARNGRLGTAGRNLGCSFLHMLALTPRVQAPEDRVERFAVEFRRVQIKMFIQENYAKPGLSTKDIADHLQITPRYVQMALAADRITPSEYLRVCRLEAARRLLSSSAFASHSITEIAFECDALPGYDIRTLVTL